MNTSMKYLMLLFLLPTLSMQAMLPQTDIGKGIKELGEAAKIIADKGVQVKASLPQTADILTKGVYNTADNLSRGVYNSSLQLSGVINATSNNLCNTVQAIPGQVSQAVTKTLQDNIPLIKPMLDKGIEAKVIIEPTALKTALTAGVGFAIALVALAIIYKELTKEQSPEEQTTVAPTTWQTIKKLVSNRYLLGITGLVSGLLIINKSNKLALALS